MTVSTIEEKQLLISVPKEVLTSKEEMKDSSKSTTSMYNDVNDFIDKIYDYNNEDNDIFSLNALNELNVLYNAGCESPELNDGSNEMKQF